MRRMLFCAAFAAVGYTLNAVRIPMFAEVGLHLGGAVAFLAAAAYGPIAAALVAAVAFAGCFFSACDPIIGALAILEAAWVGWFIHHRNFRPWTASIAFWLIFGLPAAAFYFFKFSTLATPINWAELVALPVNAAFNTIVYLPLLNCRCFWRNTRSHSPHYDRDASLRGLLLGRMVFTSLWPIVALSLIAGFTLNHRQIKSFRENLTDQISAIA